MKHIGWSRRELSEMGYIVSRDGAILSNHDGFYDDYPDDFIRTYDCRTAKTYNPQTHVCISVDVFDAMTDIVLQTTEA